MYYEYTYIFTYVYMHMLLYVGMCASMYLPMYVYRPTSSCFNWSLKAGSALSLGNDEFLLAALHNSPSRDWSDRLKLSAHRHTWQVTWMLNTSFETAQFQNQYYQNYLLWAVLKFHRPHEFPAACWLLWLRSCCWSCLMAGSMHFTLLFSLRALTP